MEGKVIISFDDNHRFLSNFWKAPFAYDGQEWPTVEHAYQAFKTNSEKDREKIRLLEKPGQAKRMGRKVQVRFGWELIKTDVMYAMVAAKFHQNENLRKMLSKTKGLLLIEGNIWHDNYWGICTCDSCGGIGENRLGQILMRVRNESPQQKRSGNE